MKSKSTYHKIKDDNILTSFKNGKKSYQIFYDNKVPTQIRFYLEDSDKKIKNKMLIFTTRHFKDKISLHYEKHFSRKGKKIIETYVNDELEAFYEITTDDFTKTTEAYTSKSVLFSREIIEYDITGKPISEKQLILNMDGTKLEYENKFN